MTSRPQLISVGTWVVVSVCVLALGAAVLLFSSAYDQKRRASMSTGEDSEEPRQYFKVAIADMPINHYTHVEVTGICTGTKLVQGNTRGRSDSCMELTHIEVLRWIEQSSVSTFAWSREQAQWLWPPGGFWLGFRLAASVRFDVALFPVPAHRTGQAHFAHPALGERFTRSPTESCLSAG